LKIQEIDTKKKLLQQYTNDLEELNNEYINLMYNGRAPEAQEEYEMAMAEDPNFERNKNLQRNIFNIVLGMAGQILLMLLPMYLILSKWSGFGLVLALLVVIFIVLKKSWWNRLSDY
jgi:hypothetical protein